MSESILGQLSNTITQSSPCGRIVTYRINKPCYCIKGLGHQGACETNTDPRWYPHDHPEWYPRMMELVEPKKLTRVYRYPVRCDFCQTLIDIGEPVDTYTLDTGAERVACAGGCHA